MGWGGGFGHNFFRKMKKEYDWWYNSITMDVASTIWTQIRAAQRNSTGAWDLMYQKYQGRVSGQISRRIRGISDVDREDIRQNVFLELSRDDFLQRANKERGRFRSLLYAVTDNIIGTWLRGEYSRRRKGVEKVALINQEEIFTALQNKSAVESAEEKVFNQEWAGNILQQALEALRAESEHLETDYHKAILGFYFDRLAGRELAKKLDVSEDTVLS